MSDTTSTTAGWSEALGEQSHLTTPVHYFIYFSADTTCNQGQEKERYRDHTF